MSRRELIQWINNKIDYPITKIEDLCSGIAYCNMLEQLYPNSIGLKRVKQMAKLEHEFLYNFKLLQAAFTRLGIAKVVPVDRLIKGRFQDNLEFVQWFKKFYDEHACLKNVTNSAHINKAEKFKRSESKKLLTTSESSDINGTERAPSPSSLLVLQEQKEELKDLIFKLDKDRTYYYNKLTQIEQILNSAIERNEKVDWCKRVLNILYANEDKDCFEEGMPDCVEDF